MIATLNGDRNDAVTNDVFEGKEKTMALYNPLTMKIFPAGLLSQILEAHRRDSMDNHHVWEEMNHFRKESTLDPIDMGPRTKLSPALEK